MSSATNPFSREELAQLLEKARTNNAARSITGMLLYKDGNFMQVLEGERQAVEQLARQIGADPRHHGRISVAPMMDWSDERSSSLTRQLLTSALKGM